jgi:CheY-like chemotaxis protein
VQELPVVLVIEDDPDIQLVLEGALTEGGFEPAIAASGEEAVTLLKGGLVKYRAMAIQREEPFAPADCHCGFSASQCPTRRPSRQPIKVWRLLQSESGDESDDESAAYDRFCIAGSLGFP